MRVYTGDYTHKSVYMRVSTGDSTHKIVHLTVYMTVHMRVHTRERGGCVELKHGQFLLPQIACIFRTRHYKLLGPPPVSMSGEVKYSTQGKEKNMLLTRRAGNLCLQTTIGVNILTQGLDQLLKQKYKYTRLYT